MAKPAKPPKPAARSETAALRYARETVWTGLPFLVAVPLGMLVITTPFGLWATLRTSEWPPLMIGLVMAGMSLLAVTAGTLLVAGLFLTAHAATLLWRHLSGRPAGPSWGDPDLRDRDLDG